MTDQPDKYEAPNLLLLRSHVQDAIEFGDGGLALLSAKDVAKLFGERDALAVEIEGLRADKKLMDWIEKQCDPSEANQNGVTIDPFELGTRLSWGEDWSVEAPTVREAIADAMKSTAL